MYKVLIVEDHALIRFGIKTALETKSYIKEIFEAASAEAALKIVKKENPDAVIMDLGLPVMNGIDASKEIKKINKDIKIAVLTSHITDSEVIDSVKAGASAYCSKDINPEMLAAVMLTVIEGALWFDVKVSDIILKKLRENSAERSLVIDSSYNLTDREKEVIKYICEGLNNGDISKTMDVSINTVKVHVSSIIQKLGVTDRTQAAVKILNASKF